MVNSKIDSKDDDLKNLQSLLDDLVNDVVNRYSNQIISIVLFGSATTSEWIKGKSDIDCIVLIKNKNLVKEIEQYLHDTLIRLDEIYHLKLSETCSPYKQTQNNALKLVLQLEKFSMFGRPFYVVSEEQIDIPNAKITTFDDLKIYVGTHVMASINLFFHRIKSTGKILYGKDITKEFPITISNLEKFKASFNAILLLSLSLVLLPIDFRFAFQHAIKANFWACDNVLFALEQPLSNTFTEVEEIKKIFSNPSDCNNYTIDVNHLQLSLNYKKNSHIENLSRIFVLKYIFKTAGFISKLYFQTLQKIILS